MTTLEVEAPKYKSWQLRKSGFRVFRQLLDTTGVELAQEQIIDRFGDAIEPLDNPEHFGVRIVGQYEMGWLIRESERARRRGRVSIMARLKPRLEVMVATPTDLTATGSALRVTSYGPPNPVSAVWLRLYDQKFYTDREEVTAVIDNIIGEELPWRRYRPLVRVGTLMDASAIEAVRQYELPEPVDLHVGQMVVRHWSAALGGSSA